MDRMPWLICVCAAAMGTTVATAQTYPTRPVRIIVPYPTGRAADILARVLADGLAKSLGQPVVIESKPGADGTTSAAAAARSEPDGRAARRS